MSITSQASGTIRKKRLIIKCLIFWSVNKILVIRKPESIKNIAIPDPAMAAFICHDLGPIGNKCPSSTRTMLSPRQPSKDGYRDGVFLCMIQSFPDFLYQLS